MRGLWFDGEQFVLKNDLHMPAIKQGEALIRVLKAGICNTDLEIRKGYMGFTGVAGHEFVGLVTESPDPRWSGKRVVGEINIACGNCAYCLAGGDPRHCPEREVLGIVKRQGAFAEFLALPLKNLYLVPENVPDNAALFIEPLAAALRIPEQIDIALSQPVAVIGDGKLGLLISAVLATLNSTVYLVGHHPERSNLPLIKGVVYVEPQNRGDLDRVPLVIEASGKPDGLHLAFNLVRPCGTIVLKSTIANVQQPPLNELVIHEINMVGSRCGPFAPAVNALENGSIDPRCMIQKEYPMAEGLRAIEHAAEPGVLKIVINMV